MSDTSIPPAGYDVKLAAMFLAFETLVREAHQACRQPNNVLNDEICRPFLTLEAQLHDMRALVGSAARLAKQLARERGPQEAA